MSKVNDINQNINKFLNSNNFKTWSNKNPISGKEIEFFIKNFSKQHKNLLGLDKVYSDLANEANGKSNLLKWFNIFSNLRCANYLLNKNKEILTQLEIKNNNRKIIDFYLLKKYFCDVKSFTATESAQGNPLMNVEYTIDCFCKRVLSDFDKQKPDFIIYDNVFSYQQNKSYLLSYAISFINDNNCPERGNLFREKLGIFLDKILILNFNQSITVNPIVSYCGVEFQSLLET